MEGNDITCKVVLVGDAGVGKTCIIQRYVNNKYKEENESTIASSYTYKTLELKKYNKTISFDIWDTAGQELYRALAKNFYINASIGIMVYDITRKESFESIKNYWCEQLKTSGEDNMIIAIAGNKCDLFTQEVVPEAEVKNYAKEIGAIFRLTSCKDSIGIDDLFRECGEKYLLDNKLIDATAENDKKNNNKINNKNKNNISLKNEKTEKDKNKKKDKFC